MGSSDVETIGGVLRQNREDHAGTPRTPRIDNPAAYADSVRSDAIWRAVANRIGERYAECSFENFHFSNDRAIAERQASVVNRLREHLENPRKGRNVVIFGPKGSGKDHLMSAAMRTVAARGVAANWWNGMDLFAAIRDRMDTDRTEAAFLKPLIDAGLLAISDPLPPTGELSSYQRQVLFQVLDARYRHLRPVWITANFSTAKEAEERMGPQLVDRLRDGALALFCDWPSYRKPGA